MNKIKACRDILETNMLIRHLSLLCTKAAKIEQLDLDALFQGKGNTTAYITKK